MICPVLAKGLVYRFHLLIFDTARCLRHTPGNIPELLCTAVLAWCRAINEAVVCRKRPSTRRDIWYMLRRFSETVRRRIFHIGFKTLREHAGIIPDISSSTSLFWAHDGFNDSSIPCQNNRSSSGVIWRVWRKHRAMS